MCIHNKFSEEFDEKMEKNDGKAALLQERGAQKSPEALCFKSFGTVRTLAVSQVREGTRLSKEP